MDLSQIIYAGLLAFAIWYGGPNWRLSALCVGNFAGTMALAASPLAVGVLDACTIAALLIAGGWRGYALAGVFAMLVPVYPVGVYFAWPNFAIYAIVDLLGYSIPGVLASGRGGHSNRRKLNRSRRLGIADIAPGRAVLARCNGANIQSNLQEIRP